MELEKNTAIMELVGSYDAYVSTEELSVNAASDAPATTLPCASVSSVPCFNSALWTLRLTC
jgi:hypothetical protein